MNDKNLRILIVRTDRIGDVILTLPMARLLKKHYPGSHITMLIRKYTEELVEDDKNIDQILFYDDGNELLPFSQIITLIKQQKFDIVFHTYPRFRLALMTWRSGIPVRVGTGYRWYSIFFNKKIYDHRKTAEYHELEYNLRLLSVLGIDYLSEDITPRIDVDAALSSRIRALVRSLGVQDGQKIVILHPGSGGTARDWNPDNFGRLAHKIGQLNGVRVIITGGKHEDGIVDRVKSNAGNSAIALVGKLNLKEYGALAKMANVFIANSTGTLHIAAAVGTPVIGLYSQITALSAKRWGPYTDKRTIFTPLNKPVDCTDCLTRKDRMCGCMETIAIEDVYQASLKYLQ
ncbi:MAG: glycosyltransferase family 9 protein [Bacteroidota bacterium]